MQEEATRQPTRLGLRHERERAGRGKGRPRRVKRGRYGPAGEGGGARRGRGNKRSGRREGARERSSAGPGRSSRGGDEEAQARPGPARPRSQRPGATRQEADRPKKIARGQVGPGGRGAVPRPLPVRSLTSSHSGYPVRSVQIVRPGSRSLTDPDPNPRRGRPAPPSRTAPASLGTRPALCLCSSRPRDSAARQAATAQVRSGGRASPTPRHRPLGSTCACVISCYSLCSLLRAPWVRSGPACGARLLPPPSGA